MADAVDADTLAAVRALWLSDTNGLNKLFPQPPATGRLKSTQPGADVDASGPSAVLDCVQGPRSNERFIVAQKPLARNDYRKVTATMRGTREQAANGVSLFLTLFNRSLGMPSYPTLTFPSEARFVRWWPLGDGQLKQDPDTKAGKDVWIGTVEGEIWSIRTEP